MVLSRVGTSRSKTTVEVDVPPADTLLQASEKAVLRGPNPCKKMTHFGALLRNRQQAVGSQHKASHRGIRRASTRSPCSYI